MAGKPEATLTKPRSGARFEVDGRISRSKTAPCAGLRNSGDAVDKILWHFVDVHQVHEQTVHI